MARTHAKKLDYVKKLSKVTFSLFHCRSCPSPFCVHLVGDKAVRLDNLLGSQSRDIRGYGRTFEEAARNAWRKKYGVD